MKNNNIKIIKFIFICLLATVFIYCPQVDKEYELIISNYEDITYFSHSTKTMKCARDLNLGSTHDPRDIQEWGQS